jgi:hypothetical protein
MPDELGNILTTTEVALESDLQSLKNISSTQWVKLATTPSVLADTEVANGMTFFTDSDKVANGTTSYNEFDIAFGIDLTLTGASGTANIKVAGVDYLATFNSTLAQTAQDWIALHGATLLGLGIRALYNGGSPINANGDETIRFSASEADCNSVAITNLTGDLGGTRINAFTGIDAAGGDHIVVPYIGEPYENKRIVHVFRTNFSIQTGSQQTLALSLRRYEDDSIISSEIKVFRTQDVAGVQTTYSSYTANASDPFVTGGFYFALRNDSGVSVTIDGDIGILIQNKFEAPIIFI